MDSYAMLIDGERVQAASGRTFDVMNPATGEVLARVPDAQAADVDRAVKAARRAFDEGWRDVTAQERGPDPVPPGREGARGEPSGWPSWRPSTPASRSSSPSSTSPTWPPASSTTAAWPPSCTARC